jgi:two-component system OmpR family response regulator
MPKLPTAIDAAAAPVAGTAAPFAGTAAAPAAARVIVVEDNPGLLDDLLFQLTHAGFSVRGAASGPALDALLAQQAYDILVLDINLPGENGFAIARRLYDRSQRGIIMLTARRDLDDKLQGLDDGADLYLVKPIDRRELVGCIRSLYRRLVPDVSAPLWQLDHARRLLLAPDGRTLGLTQQDVLLLALLATRPGQVCSRSEVVAALGIEYLSSPDSRINMMMSRLRQRLSGFDVALHIQTWRNAGYSFVGPAVRIDLA